MPKMCSCPVHLLKILALVTLLSKLWEGHVQELQKDNWWYAGGGFVHRLI